MTKSQKFAKRRNYAVQIKDVIPRIARNIDNGKANINICLNWQKIVGDEFAKYLTPIKIQSQNDKKTLLLRCVGGAEITMSYAQTEIITRINRYLGNKKINNIRLLPQNKKSPPKSSINSPDSADSAEKIQCQKTLQALAESL